MNKELLNFNDVDIESQNETENEDFAIYQDLPINVPPIPAPRRSIGNSKPPDRYGECIVPPQSSNLQEKVQLLMQVRNCCPQDASSINSAIVQLVMNA